MEERSVVGVSPKALAQRHLTAAMVCGGVSFCAYMGGSLVLFEQGYSNDWLVVLFWLINLNTARHLGLAARAQGRKAWLYGGFAAVLPVTALTIFLSLQLQHRFGSYPQR